MKKSLLISSLLLLINLILTPTALATAQSTAGISLNESHLTIPANELRRIKATDGQPVTFTSSHPNVASITNNGFVVAHTPGTAIITATRGRNTETITVEVVTPHYNDFERMRRNFRASLIPWEIDLSDSITVAIIDEIDDRADYLLSTMNRTFPENPSSRDMLWFPPRNWNEEHERGGRWEAFDMFLFLVEMTMSFLLPGRNQHCPELFDAVVAGMEFNLNNMFTGRHNGSIVHPAALAVIDELYPIGHPERERIIAPAPIRSDNWWHHDNGFSQGVIQLITLLYEAGIPDDLVQAYSRRLRIYNPNTTTRVSLNDSGGSPSHQAYSTLSMIMEAVFSQNEERLITAANALFSGTQVAINNGILGGENGNGFYWDGSYRGHIFFASSLAYGLSNMKTQALSVAAIAGETLNDAPLTFHQRGDSLMYLIDQTYLTSMWRGAAIPSLWGRSMRIGSRRFTETFLPSFLAGFIPFFSPETQGVVQEHIRSWAKHNPAIMRTPFLTNNALVRTIYEDDSIVAREWTGVFAQNHQSRVFYRSEDFVFNVAFNNANANVAPFAAGNGENLQGFLTGDGMTYLFLDNDQFQYVGDFFALVDYFRLPGVTGELRDVGTTGNLGDLAVQSTIDDMQYRIGTSANAHPNPGHTMGATLVMRAELGGMQYHVGTIGSTVFRQHMATSRPYLGMNVTANKSWFMLDGMIIALGTNITSSTGKPIVTTIDQRLISENYTFLFNNASVDSFGNAISTTNSWAHLHYIGSADGITQVGWFIPQAGHNLTIGARPQTGSWYNTNRATPIGERDYRTEIFAHLAFEHGSNPTAQTYEYVILPNATQAQTEAFAVRQASNNPHYTVVAATNTLHAVYHHDLAVLLINNFAETSARVECPASGRLFEVSGESSVIIQHQPDNSLRIAMIDPTGVQESVSLIIHNFAGAHIIGDENILVEQQRNHFVVTATELTHFQNRRFNSWEIQVISTH